MRLMLVAFLAACAAPGLEVPLPTERTFSVTEAEMQKSDRPEMALVDASAPCPAAAYQHLVGQPGENLKFPDGLLVRVIPHGARLAALDLPQQMSVWLGADGRVVRVTCG